MRNVPGDNEAFFISQSFFAKIYKGFPGKDPGSAGRSRAFIGSKVDRFQ